MLRPATHLLLLTAGCVLTAAAQNQTPTQNQPPKYVVDTCIKATTGKNAELRTYVSDVLVKIARVRVADGAAAWYVVLNAVAPAGSEARCDYHLVNGYNGFPPEASAEKTAAARKKAGITLTAEEISARANAVAHAVNVDYWRSVADVGSMAEKGQYVRINYEKLKPGQTSAWIELENTGWKPFAESLKGSGLGWHMNVLSMPGGTSQRYNAMTLDIYPTWDALGKGWPGAAWPKVHPELKFADYTKKVAETTERVSAEVYRVLESVHP